MRDTDVAAVYAIQTEAYTSELIEEQTLIQERLRSAPDTAWVAEDQQGVCAYLVAYPSKLGKITPLGAPFRVSAQADSLYLHDLAVAQRALGRRIAKQLLASALPHASAMGYRYSCLVAVQSSGTFWKRQAYTAQHAISEDQLSCLQSYAGDATYFVKTL
jgi:ribosomal protein S18 acetylase RimI-like enzyme